MAEPQTARCSANGSHNVLYRHSHTDETKLAVPGVKLPERREGVWYPLAVDNTPHADQMSVLMNGPALMWVFRGRALAVGDEINVICRVAQDLLGDKKQHGLYRVTEVAQRTWYNNPAIHITTEYIGDMDLKHLVYLAEFATC